MKCCEYDKQLAHKLEIFTGVKRPSLVWKSVNYETESFKRKIEKFSSGDFLKQSRRYKKIWKYLTIFSNYLGLIKVMDPVL